MPTVSIVIRALNEADHLPDLYEGIVRQTRQPDQVILVDSGSTDATVDLSETAGAEIVRIAPEAFSFGRALNLGCSAAHGDVFVKNAQRIAEALDLQDVDPDKAETWPFSEVV